MNKWAHLENIAIVAGIAVTVATTGTWWGMFLLLLTNVPRRTT
jgi:mannose/fructose/N-acetylgalactosamine-specific phosphotransferase system component IID